MARGYPDFFGTSIFPYVGKIINDAAIINIGAGLDGAVATLLGKRHILNVRFDLGGLLDHGGDRIGILIDESAGRTFSFNEIVEGLYQQVLPTLAFLVFINPEKDTIRGYFCGNFTVGTRLVVWYYNNTAEDIGVTTNIMSSPII